MVLAVTPAAHGRSGQGVLVLLKLYTVSCPCTRAGLAAAKTKPANIPNCLLLMSFIVVIGVLLQLV